MLFFAFRKVIFDLIVKKQEFISGMETLEEAVTSFLHICFVSNMQYPVGSGMLCSQEERPGSQRGQDRLLFQKAVQWIPAKNVQHSEQPVSDSEKQAIPVQIIPA